MEEREALQAQLEAVEGLLATLRVTERDAHEAALRAQGLAEALGWQDEALRIAAVVEALG